MGRSRAVWVLAFLVGCADDAAPDPADDLSCRSVAAHLLSLRLATVPEGPAREQLATGLAPLFGDDFVARCDAEVTERGRVCALAAQSDADLVSCARVQ